MSADKSSIARLDSLVERDLPVRAATAEDWPSVSGLLCRAFHVASDSTVLHCERDIFEPERALLVTSDGNLIAHAAALTRDLTVPGTVVPAAHVTMVAVEAVHRRRGLLRRLMHRQLREIFEAGREPVAVLWASEGPIYRRFGYDLAAQRLQLEIDSREVRLPPTGGPERQPVRSRLRGGPPVALLADIAVVYERLRPHRPGWSSRDERWWRYRLADTPVRRLGGTELQAVVHENTSGVDGYALWRTRYAGVEAGAPRGEVWLVELAATNPTAYLGLWRFVLGLELTRTVRFAFSALDEPLLHITDQIRELRPQLLDSVWIRIVDVAAALSARRYATPVDVVLEVTDAVLPENAARWRLVGDRTTATCQRTATPADLACDVADLGALYLGGVSLTALAAAGRVRELRTGALSATAPAFGWHQAPSTVEMF